MKLLSFSFLGFLVFIHVSDGFLRDPSETALQHNDCVFKLLDCDVYIQPFLVDDGKDMLMIEKPQELGETCRKSKPFIECFQKAEKFCKTKKELLPLAKKILDYRSFSVLLCERNSQWPEMYLTNAACINSYSRPARMACIDEVMDKKYSVKIKNQEENCRYLAKIRKCHVKVVSEQCGATAGMMLDKSILYGHDLCMLFDEDKKIEPGFSGLEAIEYASNLMKDLTGICRLYLQLKNQLHKGSTHLQTTLENCIAMVLRQDQLLYQKKDNSLKGDKDTPYSEKLDFSRKNKSKLAFDAAQSIKLILKELGIAVPRMPDLNQFISTTETSLRPEEYLQDPASTSMYSPESDDRITTTEKTLRPETRLADSVISAYTSGFDEMVSTTETSLRPEGYPREAFHNSDKPTDMNKNRTFGLYEILDNEEVFYLGCGKGITHLKAHAVLKDVSCNWMYSGVSREKFRCSVLTDKPCPLNTESERKLTSMTSQPLALGVYGPGQYSQIEYATIILEYFLPHPIAISKPFANGNFDWISQGPEIERSQPSEFIHRRGVTKSKGDGANFDAKHGIRDSVFMWDKSLGDDYSSGDYASNYIPYNVEKVTRYTDSNIEYLRHRHPSLYSQDSDLYRPYSLFRPRISEIAENEDAVQSVLKSNKIAGLSDVESNLESQHINMEDLMGKIDLIKKSYTDDYDSVEGTETRQDETEPYVITPSIKTRDLF